MTPAQQKRSIQRELAHDLRQKDREVLHMLRSKISNARLRRHARICGARSECRRLRRALQEHQRQERFDLRQSQRVERLNGRAACRVDSALARSLGTKEVNEGKADLRAERALQRQVRNAGKSVVRSTALERREESDDAVRRNLPAELVPVFDSIKGKIKGSPRKSRTEAFLQWAEENPGEVVASEQADADVYLEKLLQAEREHVKAMRKATRYQKSPEALRELLQDVPF